jgi:hypothetical protein
MVWYVGNERAFLSCDDIQSFPLCLVLEDAVIARFGSFDNVPEGLTVRSDNGSIFLPIGRQGKKPC